MQTLKRKAPWIILVICLGLLLFAGWNVVRITTALKKDQDALEGLSMQRIALREQEKTKDDGTLIYPDIPNLAGWITIEDTVIDYPVLWTPEDPEYYLHRNLNEEYSFAGVPFLDARTTMEDDVFILYAHNMRNDTMFGMLELYHDVDYWKDHSILQCDSLTTERDYEVCAVLSIPLTEENILQYYTMPSTQIEFEQYTKAIADNALYDTGVTMAYGDQLMILSTCDSFKGNVRTLVVARLL